MYFEVSYPRFRVEDKNGNPAVGYWVWSYKAGTSTPVSTFTDRGLSVANTNPIVLNATGEANIFVGQATDLIVTISGGDPSSPYYPIYPYLGEQQEISLSATSVVGTTNNNYVVNVTPAVSALSNNFMLMMTPDVSNTDTIGATTFTGTGINDLTASGPYIGSTSGSQFVIIIDRTGDAPPNAPTLAENAAAGLVTAGAHTVKVTFVTATGETLPSVASNSITASGSKKLDVSGIPTGPVDVIARNIYLNHAGGTTWYWCYQIADNSTTTYTISIADATLTGTAPYVAAPTTNTTGDGSGHDTFSWQKDAGTLHSAIPITGVKQILIEGFAVIFAETTGHTYNDSWTITVTTPARVDLSGLGNLLVYKNKGGSVVALDGNDMLAGYTADLRLNQALNAWLLMNPATPTFSTPTITAIRYRKEVDGTYPLVLADQGYELNFAATGVLTLLPCPQFSSRFFYVTNSGTGIVTINADGIEKIYGLGNVVGTSAFTLFPGSTIQLQTNGVSWDILTGSGGWVQIASNTLAAATSTSFTNLIPGLKYRLEARLLQNTGIEQHYIQFNADTGGNYTFSNTWNVTLQSGSLGATSIPLTSNDGDSYWAYPGYEVLVVIEFTTWKSSDKKCIVLGKNGYYTVLNGVNVIQKVDIAGHYFGAANLTSVQYKCSTGNSGTMTGVIDLYLMG